MTPCEHCTTPLTDDVFNPSPLAGSTVIFCEADGRPHTVVRCRDVLKTRVPHDIPPVEQAPALPPYVMEHVIVRVVATCPSCRRRLEREYEVATANIDAERVSGMTVASARRYVKADAANVIAARGWTDVCGLCREKREDEKEKARR